MRESSSSASGRYGCVAVHTTHRSLVAHAHSELNLVFLLRGGATRCRVADEEFMLDRSVGMLVNPWTPHQRMASDDGTASEILALFPDTRWLSSVLRLREDLPLVRLFPKACVTLTADLRDQIDRLAARVRDAAAGASEALEVSMRQLLMSLADTYVDDATRRRFHLREQAMDARIVRAALLLGEGLATTPSATEVAGTVGLSRSRFFEQFKQCIGVSPQQYVDWARMTLARRLLATDRSVAQVAGELGFATPGSFSRFFTQHLGVTPIEFKTGAVSTV
jgi:AraC-like DNA-binding protein